MPHMSSDSDSDYGDVPKTVRPLKRQKREVPEIKAEQTAQTERGIDGVTMRSMSAFETETLLAEMKSRKNLSPAERILMHKLKAAKLGSTLRTASSSLSLLTPLETPLAIPAPADVIKTLESIQSTPFDNSFLSRLHGGPEIRRNILSVDWDTHTPWMNLMEDVREHFSLAHPDREQAQETLAPIIYTILDASQLPQAHSLLQCTFWDGIDISDSLDYWPEQSTVLAMYKKLVVGIALICSPRETYITYLAVKQGWDKAQIARTMLYHLIDLNPGKDMTLHVSTNNSAMLLYNQFGFKAEEFVVGFYDQYLDSNSRGSKNAFRLRLRHH